jgi:hypothetical protein
MWGRRTPLVIMECDETALRYMNDILRLMVLPYRQNVEQVFVFMDENSRPHVVNDFLQDNDIARLVWLACSPDMNPIEHVWDRLKRAVYGRLDPPSTLREIYAESPLWSGTIWANSTLMNLLIVYHGGYKHASMQEDVLLSIRVTGVYCNLDHNF